MEEEPQREGFRNDRVEQEEEEEEEVVVVREEEGGKAQGNSLEVKVEGVKSEEGGREAVREEWSEVEESTTEIKPSPQGKTFYIPQYFC